MTQGEIYIALHELQTRIKTHGLCYIPGIKLQSAQDFARQCASAGGHEYKDALIDAKTTSSISNHAVMVIVDAPFKDYNDLNSKDKDRDRKITNKRPDRQNVPLELKSVPLIYIGNSPLTAIKIFAKANPENPIWFLGREGSKSRVLPNLKTIEHGISIGCVRYDKCDGQYEAAYEQPTLLYRGPGTGGEFVNSSLDRVAIPHCNQQNLSVAGGASGQDQEPGKGPAGPSQPGPPVPVPSRYDDFLSPAASLALTQLQPSVPSSSEPSAGLPYISPEQAGSQLGMTATEVEPLMTDDLVDVDWWPSIAATVEEQEQHPGQPRFPGRGI